MMYPSRLNLDELILSLGSGAVPANLYISNVLLIGWLRMQATYVKINAQSHSGLRITRVEPWVFI